METQPERRVSSKEVLEVLQQIKALALEKKAKEQQKARDGSYQVTHTFRA